MRRMLVFVAAFLVGGGLASTRLFDSLDTSMVSARARRAFIDTRGTATSTPAATGMNYALRWRDPDNEDRLAIRFAHPDSSTTGPMNIGADDFTIEWSMYTQSDWISGNTASCGGTSGTGWITGDIMIDLDAISATRSIGISLHAGAVAFGVRNNVGSGYTLCGAVQVADSTWHHVAVTRDGGTGEMCIYVDGTQDSCETGPTGDASYPASNDCQSWCNSDPFFVLGAEKHGTADFNTYPSYSGVLDELRVSDNVRYTANFTAPARLSSDANTLGLYHFDEGSGAVIADSSNVGTEWDQSGNIETQSNSPEWGVSLADTGSDGLKLDLYLSWDDATGTGNAALFDSAIVELGGVALTRYTNSGARHAVVVDTGDRFAAYGYTNYFTTYTNSDYHLGIDPDEWPWPDVQTGEVQCRGGFFRYENTRGVTGDTNIHGWFVAAYSQFAAPSAQYDWPGTGAVIYRTPMDVDNPSDWFTLSAGPAWSDPTLSETSFALNYNIARETTLYFEAVATPSSSTSAAVTMRVIDPPSDTLVSTSGTVSTSTTSITEGLGSWYFGNNQTGSWGGGSDGELFNLAGVFVSRGRCPGPITAPGTIP